MKLCMMDHNNKQAISDQTHEITIRRRLESAFKKITLGIRIVLTENNVERMNIEKKNNSSERKMMKRR